MSVYLSENCTIVHSKIFEKAIVKIINRKENELTNGEYNSADCFRLTQSKGSLNRENVIETLLSSNNSSSYIDLEFIPATSNIAKRFFSQTKLLTPANRRSLTNKNLEVLTILKINSHLW